MVLLNTDWELFSGGGGGNLQAVVEAGRNLSWRSK
ncbi:MAG: hypothetical protein CM15mV51_1560 [uncultured marine virus]|nr:MAG: hypothetical protein CM15mV51_1560 [uncultured marine virus]